MYILSRTEKNNAWNASSTRYFVYSLTNGFETLGFFVDKNILHVSY